MSNIAIEAKKVAEYIRNDTNREQTFTAKYIRNVWKLLFPERNVESILPADHCINRYNGGADYKKEGKGPYIFEYINYNKYRLLDIDELWTGNIKHCQGRGNRDNCEIVGKVVNNVRTLDVDKK